MQMTENDIHPKTAQELFQVMKRFSRLRWEKAHNHELKHSEFELLGILYSNQCNGIEAITASELSNKLQITPGGVTHLVNPLEEAGFIERLPDPNDRRVVLIGLTAEGKALTERKLEQAHQHLNGLVEHLGEADSRTLMRLLSALIEYFSQHPLPFE